MAEAIAYAKVYSTLGKERGCVPCGGCWVAGQRLDGVLVKGGMRFARSDTNSRPVSACCFLMSAKIARKS